MQNFSILILVALPQEYARLKRLTGPWTRLCRMPFSAFRLAIPDKEVVLIETGMGGNHAAHAFDWAVARHNPQLVLSLGFAGSLDPALKVGEVLLAKNILRVTADQIDSELRFFAGVPAELEEFCRKRNIAEARLITSDSPARKLEIHRAHPGPRSLIDMESAILADAACRRGLPLICLRAVSDALDDRIGFDLGEINGPDGKVRIGKVLQLAARRPGVIANFYGLWRRSSKAAGSLGDRAVELLRLSASELGRIAEGSRIACR